MPEEDTRLLPYLPAHTRQETEKGITVLVPGNWQELARAHANTPVSRRALTLLKIVASRATQPQAVVKIDARLDYPLVDAASVGALTFLLDYLIDGQYLRREGGQRYVVTVVGWEYLGRILLGEAP